MVDFNPNRNDMSACVARIAELKKNLKIDDKKIFTSKDCPGIWKDAKGLVDNIPGGFNKVILPFMTTGEATFYISSAGPNTVVPRHSHDEGAGIRFIVSGSIIYNEVELTEGDWMYMPAGAAYEFTVGPRGVTIFYCYQCCCA